MEEEKIENKDLWVIKEDISDKIDLDDLKKLGKIQIWKYEPYWISVKKQLPYIGQEVIIKVEWVIGMGGAEKARAKSAIYTDKIDGEPMFCDISLYNSYPETEYWYPLPKI